MTSWFAFLVLVAAINPPRLRPYVDLRRRPARVVAAAAIVLGVGALLVIAAGSILEALEVTDETWHLGAGVVGMLVGGRVLVAPGLGDWEVPDGWGAAAAPYAFPLLFTPQLAVLAVLLGATEPKMATVGWLAGALALVPAVCLVPYRRAEYWAGTARFLGALLVILSVALVVAGVRDV